MPRPRLVLAAGGFALAIVLVALGAMTQIAALTMPGVALAALSSVPLVAGVWRRILGTQISDDSGDSLIQ